jgi:raffinose/stachyose/melibiose transport system substrate-binding protein
MVVKGAFNTDYDQAFALFQQGEAAMMVNGSWMLGDVAERIGEHIDYLGYPLADPATTEKSRYNMAGGSMEGGYSVAASASDVDTVARYAIQYAMLVGKYRVVKKGYCTPLLKENPEPEKPHKPIQKKFLEEATKWQTMTIFPFSLNNLEFKTAIEEGVEKLMLGEDSYTPDDFIVEIEKAMSKQ